MINVCIISGAYPPLRDGIGDYTARLTAGLGEASITTHVVTCAEKAVGQHACGERQHVRVYPIVKKWNIVGVSAVLKLVLREKFEIAHIQYPSVKYRHVIALCFLPLFLRVIARNVQTVVTLHEYAISCFMNRLRQYILALLSHRVIVADQGDCIRLSSWLPFAGRKISVVPVGSNIEVYRHAPEIRDVFMKNTGLSNNVKILCFFGNIHSNKGIECLLRSIARLHTGNQPVYLLLISTFDTVANAYHREIMRLINVLGIQKHVLITGYSDPEKVSYYLSLSDICVLPFRDGVTFRRGTLMAAFAHGKPVISTASHKYLPEGLVHGENIFLTAVNDDAQLSEAIRHLCLDSGLRKKIADGGQRLAEMFSWKAIADYHRTLYEAALKKK